MKWQDDPDLQTYGVSIPDGEEWTVEMLAEPEKVVGKFGPVWTVRVHLEAVNGAPSSDIEEPLDLRVPRGLVMWLARVAPVEGVSHRRFAIRRTGTGLGTRHDARSL